MLRRVIFLSLIIISGCGNPPAPREINAGTKAPAKPKTASAKPAVNPWKVSSFALQAGDTAGRKYVKYVTEGNFSDSVNNKSYLYAEVFVHKINGGIFLHELEKTNPAQKFEQPVQIKLTNSSGETLEMVSSRRWNASGGILIERNNNDYSQFRIFMMRNKGPVTVEISSGSKIYHFTMNSDGFSDSFSQL